jgi:hypothetical protein
MGNECVYTCGVLLPFSVIACLRYAFFARVGFLLFSIPSMVTLMLMIESLSSNHRETVDVTYSLGRLRNREKQDTPIIGLRLDRDEGFFLNDHQVLL